MVARTSLNAYRSLQTAGSDMQRSKPAEPRDAVQEVINQVFNPQAESSTPRGTHATACAALVRPNGETITRGMSRNELMRYEQLVQSHIRDPSVPSIFDAGAYSNEGRLSFEYQQQPPEDFDIDRSVNLSSSSHFFWVYWACSP